MCVPPRKYPSRTSTRPSVSKLAIRDWPCVSRCVEVNPRKSWEPSGIRSAPWIPAALAICFGSPGPPENPPPLKTLADARQLEQAVCVREQRAGRVGDVLPLVAPEKERDVVGLEDRRVRVAREALRVLERRHRPLGAGGCAPIDRKMPLGRPRNQPAEVGQPPRDGDRKAGRARLVPRLERAERLLERPLRLAEVTASLHGKPRR